MLTEIIPIENLYAASAASRDFIKTMSIIFSSSAIISTISSSTLIWMILRSPQRLTTTRHRILFGMAVGDIIFSLSLATYGAMLPSCLDYYVWNAQGNQATCNVSGFMTAVGVLMSPLYTCSLNIYSLAIVKYNKTDSYIQKKMEPFLHGVPIVISLAFGFALLATQGYNSHGVSCIDPVYHPPHCIGIEDGQVREGFEIQCGRGRDGPSTIVFAVGFFCLFFGSPTTVGVTLGMMYRHVSRQERRMGRYGGGALNHSAPQENINTTTAASVDGSYGITRMMRSSAASLKSAFGRLSSRSTSSQNNSKSRFVMIRARAYSTTFLLTYSWYMVIIVLGIAGVSPPPLALIYLGVIFAPLQGFWNLMIFMYPKVMKAKRSRGGNLSWCQATTEAFCPAINRWRERRTVNNDGREIPGEEEKPEIPDSQQQQGDAESAISSLSRGVYPAVEEEETKMNAKQQGDTRNNQAV